MWPQTLCLTHTDAVQMQFKSDPSGVFWGYAVRIRAFKLVSASGQPTPATATPTALVDLVRLSAVLLGRIPATAAATVEIPHGEDNLNFILCGIVD